MGARGWHCNVRARKSDLGSLWLEGPVLVSGMLAPSPRLILISLLLAPAVLLPGDAPEMAAFVLGGYFCVAIVALGDASAGRKRSRQLEISLPEVTRVSKDHATELKLQVTRKSEKIRRLAIGLIWPEHLKADRREMDVTLGESGEKWQFSWPFTARRRGLYRFGEIFFELVSPLGLWTVRRELPQQAEVRVFPNLRHERQQLANLFMNRGLAGMKLQRMVGQGREYERLREYSPGDSLLDIHWKASAKHSELVTKTYQVERTQEIYLVMDASRLSGRRIDGRAPEEEQSVLERFVTAASVLNIAANRNGDLFGLIAHDDRILRFLRASSGGAHQRAVQNALFTLESSRTTPDIDEVVTFIRTRLRRRALIIWLTDLSDPILAEALIERIRLVAGKHLLLVGMCQSPNVGELFDPARPVEGDEDIYHRLAGHLRWQKLRRRQIDLRVAGADMALFNEEKLAVEIVNRYLQVKLRQLI